MEFTCIGVAVSWRYSSNHIQLFRFLVVMILNIWLTFLSETGWTQMYRNNVGPVDLTQ